MTRPPTTEELDRAEAAVLAHGDSTENLDWLAFMFFTHRRWDKARGYYAKLVERVPDNASYHYYPRCVCAAGVPVTVLGARVGFAGAAVWPRVAAWLARTRPAVVQTHLFFAQVMAGTAALALGAPALVHVEQNFYAWKGGLARACERAAL